MVQRTFYRKKNKWKQMNISKEKIDIINSRFKTIKFPENVLKMMPQLQVGRYLKAMEYEIILFYGFLCFEGIYGQME